MRILLIQDAFGTESLATVLSAAGHFPVLARDLAKATGILSGSATCEVVLLAIGEERQEHLQFIERVRSAWPDSAIVLFSSQGNVRFAVSAMQLGAYDYRVWPLRPPELERVLSEAAGAGTKASYERQDLERLVLARTEMLRRAMADLERSYDITLEALGNALDLKDAETEGHSKRVTAYSIVLARAMQIEAAEVKVIARGAFLHDIGKMAIPDAILAKPGKLTAEEQAIMREHCVRGYTIVRKIPFLQKASEIVFSHQEHFDGSGYSRGLKGEEIPLGARIFSVADALDAITSDRPYRKAQSFSYARREIERCSGTQFDPQIVEVYRGLPDRLWEELRAEMNQPRDHSQLDPTEPIRNQ